MRAEKQLLLNDIKEQISRSPSFIITNYNAVKAKSIAEFRNSLRAKDADLEVVSRSMFLKAASILGIEIESGLLKGHIGIVFARTDAVETAKTIIEFSKATNKAVSILGGYFDGRVCDAQTVERYSQLPSKEQMRAEFLGLLEAPMSQTLATMEALICSVMYCLENKAKLLSEDGQ